MGSSRIHLYGHQRLETRKKPVVFRRYRRVLDGHDFISPELYSKGCVGIVGNRVCDGWDKGFVHVEVLEVGMSGKGEILELARMAKPHIRVVLNVGASHLESLTSLEEVAMAKGEIFRDAKWGDVCILNGDDPLVTSLPVPYGVRKLG